MFKTFVTGIVLGVAAVIAALYYVPVVDQYREVSIISVSPNGGNSESFHVNVPMDRIMVGAQGRNNPLPPGMAWPEDEVFGGARTELFKLRNSRNAVIGVASRMAIDDDQVGDVIEWVLHLPARGSMFVSMRTSAVDGRRVGELRAGTREFGSLFGDVSERWVAQSSDLDNSQAGRIELVASFVSSDPGPSDLDVFGETEEGSAE